MRNYSCTHDNTIYVFKHYMKTDIGIIHHYGIYSKDNIGIMFITRILTKHPISWNRYRTKYKIIRKIKKYYVLEHIECLSFETINFLSIINKEINKINF